MMLTGSKLRRSAIVLAIVASACTSTSPTASQPGSTIDRRGQSTTSTPTHPEVHWVRSWGASQQSAEPPFSQAIPERFERQTIRQTIHISKGGATFRLQFSNAFGAEPLRIGGARLAIAASPMTNDAGNPTVVAFGGQPTVVIAPGAATFSDDLSVRASDGSDLAVTIYLPDATPASTFHALASQDNFVSPTGNFLDQPLPQSSVATRSWFFLAAVDVVAADEDQSIVAFGDSITDGYQSTVNSNRRWPDRLATRLRNDRASGRTFSVVNAGINGNRVRYDTIGASALTRFERDALSVPAVKYVVLLEGINDIGLPGAFGRPNEILAASDMINNYRALIERAHSRGIKIIIGTLTPFGDTAIPGYYSASGEATRVAVNQWIRTSGASDDFFDFDAALRDPALPARLLAKYDSGDHLHPNDAGYEAIANAIDLSLFTK